MCSFCIRKIISLNPQQLAEMSIVACIKCSLKKINKKKRRYFFQMIFLFICFEIWERGENLIKKRKKKKEGLIVFILKVPFVNLKISSKRKILKCEKYQQQPSLSCIQNTEIPPISTKFFAFPTKAQSSQLRRRIQIVSHRRKEQLNTNLLRSSQCFVMFLCEYALNSELLFQLKFLNFDEKQTIQPKSLIFLPL